MEEIYIYNTLDRKKEKLKTIKENVCNIYSCGPTVYSYAHIGNFRYFLFVDLLRRALKMAGYKLNHVINITDVGHLVSDADEGEDKMMKASRLENKSPWEIAKFYEEAFLKDCEKLNIFMPEKIVKATDNIKEMEEYVKKIIENGYAYQTENTIYFDTSKLDEYGVLSKIDAQNQMKGARVDFENGKRNVTDFAIWIKAPENHIMKWDSFFGKAYPGWHIECSAMSKKYLGEEFDIHTGGADHIHIHHENEIAQSKGFCGKNPARYWVHSEFLQVDGGKMSKSLGNTYTISNLEEKGYSAMDFRFLSFNSHYRTKMNFRFDALTSAKSSLLNLRKLYLKHKLSDVKEPSLNEKQNIDEYLRLFKESILDDLNMPVALSYVFKIAKLKDKSIYAALALEKCDEILGLNLIKSEKYIEEEQNGKDLKEDENYIEALKLLEKRNEYKREKDYKKADEIREKIENLGYLAIDTKEGSRLEKK